MLTRYEHNKLEWIDLESPTAEELHEIIKEYHIDSLVADELLSPTLKPKVDLYKKYIYLVLHFPAIKHSHGESANQEIDFIIGKDFLITTRYDSIDPLHKFSKVFEVNAILDKNDIGEHAGYLFYYMIKKLYRSMGHEIDYVSDRLRIAEERIFNGEERNMVQEISDINRLLLNFKHALSLHHEVLNSLEKAGEIFFGKDFSYHLNSVMSEYQKIAASIQLSREFLTELRETNDSLLSAKQNEVMKNLTLMAFVTFPLSLIAVVFSTDAKHTPIVGDPFDFWIIIGLMFAVALCMILVFKRKKWL